MMIEVTCPCGRVLKAPEQYAGRKGRCKGCGAVLMIPAQAELGDPDHGGGEPPEPQGPAPDLIVDDAFVAGVLAPDPPPQALPQAPAETPTAAHAAPPEPWYYGFVEAIAVLVLIAGLFGGGVGLIVNLPVSDPVKKEGEQVTGSVPAMVGYGVFLVSSVLWSSSVFVALDLARNIRAIRYAPRSGPE